ncbi:DUF3237 family protein [Rhodococcoides trifolii]|uniref:DUF3237 family protein n=1 Tax=Rhodococcoides trifolii TaxID=908250 RepID=UPI001666B45F|nr:DUF3237 family protein [Rhodococcus trifolii]
MTAPILPTLEPLLTLVIETGDGYDIGDSPAGADVVVPVTGGTVDGPGISGRILPGGVDVRTTRADGSTTYTADMVVDTADGLLRLHCTGFRFGSTEVTAAVAEGQTVDPALYYFRGTLEVTTAVRELTYLNRALLVTSGAQDAESVVLAAFLVT